MPEQFVVPQFLDVEPKIFGPVTMRQFAILLATLLIEFFIYSFFLNLIAIIALGLPVLLIGLLFAFGKLNTQPFHVVMLNMIYTLRRSRIRVWDKNMTTKELRARLYKEEFAPPPAPIISKPLSKSRLSDLALTVNTGGVYQVEE